MPFSFACPTCQKVLKSSTPVAAGKTVKCPGCQTTFKVPDDDESVQAKAPPVSNRDRGPRDDHDDRPRSRRSREDDDDRRPRRSRDDDYDDDPDDRPRSRRSRDDDEEDDDRPRRRSSRGDDEDDYDDDREKPRKKGGKGLFIALTAGGGILLLILLLTAFVWPGFLLSGNPPGIAGNGGADDPLNFLPAEANMVAGVNVVAARKHPLVNRLVDKVLNEIPQLQQMQKDLIVDVEFAMVGVNFSGQENGNAVIGMKNPQDPEKVRAAFNAQAAVKVEGKNLFKGQAGEFFAVPRPKILLAGKLNDDQINRVVDGKAAAVNADLAGQVRRISRHALWIAVVPDAKMRQTMQQAGAQQMLPQQFMPPQLAGLGDLTEALSVLQKGKVFTAHADISDGKSIKLEVGVVCEAAADAKKVETALNKAWNEIGKGFLPLMRFGMMNNPQGQIPGLGSLLSDLETTLKATSDGPLVAVSLIVSENTLKEGEAAAGGLLNGIGNVKKAAENTQSINNLKQMMLALHNYHDTYKRFPANVLDDKGNPILSWRVQILPFVGEQKLYKEFDLKAAWDSPKNKPLINRMPKVFTVPGGTNLPGLTHYQSFAGPGAVFDPSMKNGVRLTDIPDGSSNTLGVVEAKHPVVWTKPDDLTFFPKNGPLPQLGVNPTSFNAVFCDGVARKLTLPMDPTTLRALITRNGGEAINNLP